MTKYPMIMGILNITPNSFSDGGDFFFVENALMRAEEMLNEGANIIDIGGESTAPGNESVSTEEEWKRLEHIVSHLLEKRIPISLDTKKAEIMEKFFALGGELVNDVSGMRQEEEKKLELLKKFPNTKIVCMFSREYTEKETPSMIMEEIFSFFENRIELFYAHEIDISRLIFDPGMGGFLSKNPEISFEVLRRFLELKKFAIPVLVGTSRKSFLRKISDPLDPKKRLISSVVSALCAVQNGADIVRVHDVKATKEGLDTFFSVFNPE